MIDKELNEKWDPLLEDLTKSELQKNKYAKAYERIVKNNNAIDYKILLGVAHRIFSKDKNITVTRGKERVEVNEFFDSEFSLNGQLLPELTLPFVEATADIIVGMCHKSDNTFSHLEIKNNKVYYVR